MKSKMIKGYKFVSGELKSNNNFQWEAGKWFKHVGELRLCNSGFHACISPLDSLNYIYGDRWFIVEARGEIEKCVDKFVASEMRLVKDIPAKRVSVLFSIACARRCLRFWKKKYPNDSRVEDAILAAEAWVNNPCKKTQDAAESAWSAAWSAWSAAESAARSAEKKWQNKTLLKIIQREVKRL